MNYDILDTGDEEELDGVLIGYALQGFERDGHCGEVVVRFVGDGHNATLELPTRYDGGGFYVGEPENLAGVSFEHVDRLRGLLEMALNPDDDVDF